MSTALKDLAVIVKIAERSETMKIGGGDRLSRLMDLDFAHEKFDLRLADFLKADDLNFAHDFIGIQKRISRASSIWNDDGFVPRFAR